VKIQRLKHRFQKKYLMMKGKYVFLFFSFWLVSCGSDLETIEVKNDEGVIVETYTRKKVDYAKEGLYQKFSDQGVLIEKSNYRNDTLEGERTLFYENGNPQYIENYKKGQFEGPFKAYHDNGTLKLEGIYTDNAMEGEWKAYYENGQLKEIVQFENNQENGPFIEYHPNGKLKAKGSYLEGDHEHGELELYDESGELFKKMMCDKGICRTSWQRDTTTMQE
jgi:antitoxin component YwqK of YwqJK toxin-antitoxin module